MDRRRFLSSSTREILFGIPSDTASLERFYVLSGKDLSLVRSRRKPENRLSLAIHLALLRHPGQGWREGVQVPEAVSHWLSKQVNVSPLTLATYGTRETTRTTHRSLATRRLGLRPFVSADFQIASDLAAQAAFDTDDARLIMSKLLEQMRRVRLVLPAIGTLERIGQSRLTWLRGMPHSTSSASLHGLLARLKFVRALGLPPDLGEDVYPVRLTKFAREGAVAPAHLLSDFGSANDPIERCP